MSTQKRISALLATGLLTLAAAAGAQTVVDETSRDLGHGFEEVRQTVTQAPGVGGASQRIYLYFDGIRLCSCGKADVALSPSGRWAVMVNDSTALTVFDAYTREIRDVRDVHHQHLTAVHWSEAQGAVQVRLAQNDGSAKQVVDLMLPDVEPDQPARAPVATKKRHAARPPR